MHNVSFQSIRSPRTPNVIFKQKLPAIPILKQMIAGLEDDSDFLTLEEAAEKNRLKDYPLDLSIIKIQKSLENRRARSVINNYSRLCDQPFLEYTSHHLKQIVGTAKRPKRLAPLKTLITLPPDNEYNNRKAYDLLIHDHDISGLMIRSFIIDNLKQTASFHSIEVKLSSPIGRIPSQIIKVPLELLKEYIYMNQKEMITTILNAIKKVDEEYVFSNISTVEISKKITPSKIAYQEKVEGLKATVSRNAFKATIFFPVIRIKDTLDGYKKILSQAEVIECFKSSFDNLRQYIVEYNEKQKKKFPSEKLRKLPDFVKKVILTKDFGGVLTFKSIEIELKPRDFDPKIARRASSIMRKGIVQVPIHELEHLYYYSQSELLTIITRSIKFDERKGYVLTNDQKGKPALIDKKEEKLGLTANFEIFLNKTVVDGIIRYPSLELYIPDTGYKEVLPLNQLQIMNLLEECFENMRDMVKEFKNPEFNKTARARILRYYYEDKDIAKKNQELEEQFANVTKETNLFVKSVNLADIDFVFMESEFSEEVYQSYIKSRSGTDKLEPTLLRQYKNIKWSEYILLTCSQSTPTVIKFAGMIKRLCLNPEIARIMSKKKIFFMIVFDDELKERNNPSLRNYIYELQRFYKHDLKMLDFDLKKNLIVSTFPAEGRINLKSITAKLTNLDYPFEPLARDDYNKHLKLLKYRVKVEDKSTPFDHTKLKGGRLLNTFEIKGMRGTISLVSLTLILEEYNPEGTTKFVHKYTIEFASLLELILISEYQDLRDFFKEHFKVKKFQKKNKTECFQIIYTYESVSANLEGYRLSEVHYRNSFLQDFNFDSYFGNKRFLVKVHFPFYEIYDPSDGAFRTIKVVEDQMELILSKSFNIEFKLEEL